MPPSLTLWCRALAIEAVPCTWQYCALLCHRVVHVGRGGGGRSIRVMDCAGCYRLPVTVLDCPSIGCCRLVLAYAELFGMLGPLQVKVNFNSTVRVVMNIMGGVHVGCRVHLFYLELN
jgi:hypothetical protein